MPVLIAFLLLVVAAPALAQVSAGRCDGEVWPDRLSRIEEHGDLRTASGRLLKLVDIRLDTAARARLASLEGEAIAVGAAGAADRWGRLPARVLLSRDGTDLAALLLRDGLALVDVGERDGLCRPGLFEAEAEARREGRGWWASIRLPADEPDAVAARAGRFAVIEGVVVSVGERARWTYLNFGRDFRRDFAVSITRRNWDAMKRAGLSAAALKGRRIRVRGVIERRRAPGMEIASPDMIEWREAGDAAVPPSGR